MHFHFISIQSRIKEKGENPQNQGISSNLQGQAQTKDSSHYLPQEREFELVSPVPR